MKEGMKNYTINIFATAILAILITAPACAQTDITDADGQKGTSITECSLDGVIDDAALTKTEHSMEVTMTMLLDDMDVKSNRAVVLTPYLIGRDDSVELPSVGVYGRRRYYHYKRSYSSGMIKGSGETWFKAKDAPEEYDYAASLTWQDWMDNSSLVLVRQDYGCCEDIKEECDSTLARHKKKVYRPKFNYARPTAEAMKMREESGVAYVTFPVNSIGIWPDYRENKTELGKIDRDISAVKNDKDMTITAVYLKGYASPEGSYSNNERLAKGRVAALKQYVLEGSPDLNADIIKTDYEAENWDGLRKYVEASDLENKGAIMSIIDSPGNLDEKEKKIKSQYPKDYSTLLAVCYPALRRTDYRVEYKVVSFSDVNAIRKMVRTNPKKLSLEEFYLAAMAVEPGSEEFNNIFDVAVRMYPNDPTANLNAAINAMERGDLETAGRYINKAGTSAEANHAKDVYLKLKGDRPLTEEDYEYDTEE